MSPRRTKPQPLSDTEIRQISADLAEGRPPMVWFTSDAVGVPEGRSGKVLALGDPAEGDFLQVRPTGSKDVLSFSPTEVTLIKPARAAAAKPRKDTAVSMPSIASSSVSAAPVASSPSPGPGSSANTHHAAPQNGAANHDAAHQDSSSSASKPAESEFAAKAAPAKAPARPAQKAAAPARKPKAAEVTVTLSGTADGEWTVDVVNGKKRTVRGLSVSGSAVAQAAKLLHPEVAEVVDSVLDSVRNSQRVKVELLQAELEQARKVLDELQG